MDATSLKHITALLSLLFFLLFVVFWSATSLNAFGAAWFSLLTSSMLFATSRNIATNEVSLFKKRDYSKFFKFLYTLDLLILLVAFLITCFKPPINGDDKFLKPLFIFFAWVAMGGLIKVLSHLPTADSAASDFMEKVFKAERKSIRKSVVEMGLPSDEELIKEAEESDQNFEDLQLKKRIIAKELEKPEEQVTNKALTRKSRCRECCRECCLDFLLVLVFLACLFCFYDAHRRIEFFDDFENVQEGRVFANSPSQAFRCSNLERANTTVATVVFWHGYGGQGLDFSHTFASLSANEDLTVCFFDRQGYGSSREFSDNLRVSSNFAIEAEQSFAELGLPQKLVFVGHSMAGFNMRAFDILFPGRISAMVMVDPVDPGNTKDCFKGGLTLQNSYDKVGVRLADSGLLLLLEWLRIYNIIAPIYLLPENVQRNYVANIMRKDYFQTSIDEGSNWGEDCAFILDNFVVPVSYPVTVLIPEHGIHENDIEFGLGIANISVDGRSVLVEGDDAFHVEMVFKDEFAAIITEEALSLINKVTNSSLGQ